jgi:hypothetical protein
MADADDSAPIGADQRYFSLEPHGARGVPWRSRMTPDDIRIGHLVTFAVAAERLARKADVGLDAARSWLFEHCRRGNFVLLEVPPDCIQPRLSAPSAFLFREGVRAVTDSRLQVLCDEVEAATPYLREDAAPQPEEKAASEGPRKGRPASYPWEDIAACFGALLWDERPEVAEPEGQVITIQAIAKKLDCNKEPERATVQEHRDRWIAAFRKWKGKDDAGN